MVRFSKHPLFLLFLLAYLLHLLGVLGFVSHFEWGTGRPLLTDDYALRSSLLYDTRILFKTSRSLWGYSPYHLAGYPYALFAISAKGEQILSLLLPFVNPAELLKFYILISMLTFPFLIMASARVLKLQPSSIVIAGMISILFFWKYPNISMARWGSISYLLACPLALLSLTFFLRSLKEATPPPLFLFWLLGSTSLLLHSVALIILLLPIALSLVLMFKEKPRGVLLLGWSGLFGMAVANLFWIAPFLKYHSVLKVAVSEPAFLEGISFHSWYFQKDVSRILLLLFGCLGIWEWFRQRNSLALPFVLGIAPLIGLLFFLKHPTALLLQRFRYDWPLSLFLSLPASAFLAEKGSQAFRLLCRDGKGLFPIGLRKGFLFLFCGMILLALITSDRTRYTHCLTRLFLKEKTFASSYPLPTSMRPPEMNQLLAWVLSHKEEEGRFLMEDTHHPHHIYWGSHLPAILPLLTGREIINSPLPEAPVQTVTIGLTDGKLLGKPIEQFSPSTFRDYVDLYNIRWIICFSPMAKRYFGNLPNAYLHEDASIGHFSCYEINRQSNFFLKGSGKVSADFNRVSLKEVHAESGEIILTYRWFPGLHTLPEREIERTNRAGDPIGFIKIENPPETLEVTF